MENESPTQTITDQSPESQKQSWKLYLGGIPVDLNEEDLEKLFQPLFKKFKVTIMRAPGKQSSKGCGLLDVYNIDDFNHALTAKIQVQDKYLQIEEYIVNEEERKKRMFENNEKSIHVGGLPLEAGKDDLEEYFSKFGKIARAYIIFSLGEQKKSRGFGFVQFHSKKNAQKVLNLPHCILGKEITISQRHTKKEIKEVKNKDSTKAPSISGSSISSKSKTMKGSKKTTSTKVKAQPSMDFSKTSKPMNVISGKNKSSKSSKGQKINSVRDLQLPQSSQKNNSKNHAYQSSGMNLQQGWNQAPGLASREHMHSSIAGMSNQYSSHYNMPNQQPQYWNYHPHNQYAPQTQAYSHKPGAIPPHPTHTYGQQMPQIYPHMNAEMYNTQMHDDQADRSKWGQNNSKTLNGDHWQGYAYGNMIDHPKMRTNNGYSLGQIPEFQTVRSQPVKATSKAADFTFDARKQFNPFTKHGKQPLFQGGQNLTRLSNTTSFDLDALFMVSPQKTSENFIQKDQLEEISESHDKIDLIQNDVYKLMDSSEDDN